MKNKNTFFITLALIIIVGVFLNYKQNHFERKRIRKPYKAFVKRPFGTPLKKEPDAVTNEWMAYQRCYPYEEIKLESYLLGMDQASELHRNSPNMRYDWELVGPTNIGGRITDLAIHPNSPEIFYVGAASGGVFKTTDNGQNWENVFANSPVISIGDIAIDPDNENILYVGTGEANASSYSFLGNGIYKTTNAGESWQHIGLTHSAYIGRILVDHTNSERIFVAACGNLFSPNEERGIYRSDDSGLNWDRKLYVTDSTSAIDLIQHPTDTNVLYAVMWERMRGLTFRHSFGETSGIWKTTDGGDNWFELTNGLPTGNNVGRIGIDISRSNPDVLYAFYDMPDAEVRVYKTSNSGESWTRTNDNYLDGMNSYFGWYFGQIRVDPTNENRVYVLGVELYRSDNAGNSWILLADYGNMDEIHVDHHALEIDENSGRIMEGNDGGLYYSFDLGENWTKIDNIPLTQFYAIEIDRTNPYRIYGGTQDNSTIRTLTGNLDDWHVILGGDGFYCLVDYDNPNIIYAEYQWGNLYKSTNGGSNMYPIYYEMENDRKNWSSPLAMHPSQSNILYFGTYRIWKTTDYGEDWTAVSSDLTDGDSESTYHTITTIAVSPLDPEIVIAGTDDGNVHISQNGGNSWSDITDGLPDRWITRVAADPFDTFTIYATVSGFRWDEPAPHVFKSDDLGLTWIDISSNLPEIPMNSIILDPSIHNRIFVGSDAGIFYSGNGGDIWVSISEGIPNVPITDMKIHNETRTLVIGTYGCSAYKINLDTGFTGIENDEIQQAIAVLHQNHPNPFNPDTKISYSLYEQGKVELSIYNIKGQIVKILVNDYKVIGKHSVIWNGRDSDNKQVSSGSYFYKLNVNGKTEAVRKCLLMK
ncbi:MAG: T9SS type A sorting domain-containing protein [Candidatus Cloacimonetes bacterium]|nr:T9SS type A sorting domain-containing protein [Candidatus Cloacimonadota bacterium]